MQFLKNKPLILFLPLLVIVALFGYNRYQKPPIMVPIRTTTAITPLWSFTVEVMKTCKANLSSGKSHLLAKQIARIAESQLDTRTHQEAFVLLVCIESKFEQASRSKAGAVGLTQLMPKYAPSFAKDCGLEDINAKDIEDSEINLTVGACNFKALLNKFDGNVTLSLAGYNSGPDSPTTKGLKKLQAGHPETGWYISKFAMLREEMNKQ